MLCLVKDVTLDEQSWHLCLWKYLFSFSVLSFFFFFQFTITFYLFVQKNKLVICTLHVAFCRSLLGTQEELLCAQHMHLALPTTNF